MLEASTGHQQQYRLGSNADCAMDALVDLMAHRRCQPGCSDIGSPQDAAQPSLQFNDPQYADLLIDVVLSTLPPPDQATSTPDANTCSTSQQRSPLPGRAYDDIVSPHDQQQNYPRKFHAHAAVLVAASPFFSSLLEKRTAAQSLVLQVAWEERNVAERMLEFLYSQQLQLDSDRDLLLCLQLANRFMVQGCVKACCRTLQQRAGPSSSAADPTWPLVLRVLNLPSALLANQAVQALHAHVRLSVHAAFTQLEHAWRDPAKQDVFCKLPHAVLLELLEQDTLEVSSENTTFIAACSWVAANISQSPLPAMLADMAIVEQLEQILHRLRFPQMTSTFLGAVVPAVAWPTVVPSWPQILHETLQYSAASPRVRSLLQRRYGTRLAAMLQPRRAPQQPAGAAQGAGVPDMPAVSSSAVATQQHVPQQLDPYGSSPPLGLPVGAAYLPPLRPLLLPMPSWAEPMQPLAQPQPQPAQQQQQQQQQQGQLQQQQSQPQPQQRPLVVPCVVSFQHMQSWCRSKCASKASFTGALSKEHYNNGFCWRLVIKAASNLSSPDPSIALGVECSIRVGASKLQLQQPVMVPVKLAVWAKLCSPTGGTHRQQFDGFIEVGSTRPGVHWFTDFFGGEQSGLALQAAQGGAPARTWDTFLHSGRLVLGCTIIECE